MSEGEGFDFQEAFLQANANNDSIAGEVEDLLRILMRGTASQDPGANAYKAVEKLVFIIDLVKRCDRLDPYKIVTEAMHGVAGVEKQDGVGAAIIEAAKDGVMLLVESSAQDGFARGRASKRRSEFLRSLERIQEARAWRRQER